MKIVVFQVLQQDSSPHRFLTVATGKTSWGIRPAVDERSSYIHSASAGTSCPSSSSSSVSKREGWNSWRYYENSKWQDGDIEVSCSNCNDMVLFTESVDSVHSSYQSLVQTGAKNVFSKEAFYPKLPAINITLLINFSSTKKLTFFIVVPDIELRTTGPAGEHHGERFGVYQLHSEDESHGRVYRQRHDQGGTQHYLYK